VRMPENIILTLREKEIIKLIAEGLTNIQIGEKLFISARTADVHRTNIMKKIDVHNVAGLVRFAFQHGLMD
jgi:DNA-binding CsgD family transcriptional regulator